MFQLSGRYSIQKIYCCFFSNDPGMEEEGKYLASNIPKNILLHKWIQFRLNPLLLLRLRQLVRSRSLFFILAREETRGQGSDSDRGCYFSRFPPLKNKKLIFLCDLWSIIPCFNLSKKIKKLSLHDNFWTLPGVIMYSPTISIRITDADTRGRRAEIEGRPDQNTHREKLRQEGQHLSTECLLFHSPFGLTLDNWQDQLYIHNNQAFVPSKSRITCITMKDIQNKKTRFPQ